jgi:predicted DNA-binding antitoxin AbrB/MazE fold protein
MITAMKLIDASYEGGILRPAEPLPLRAGEHVRIIVLREPDASRWDLDRLAAADRAADTALAEAGLAAWADELDREDRRR